MKKTVFALMLIFLIASPAFAVFSSKGQIPNGAPVEYRGLKIISDTVNITVVNKGEAPVIFSAACAFVAENRKEFGDFFIEEIKLEPGEARPLSGLNLRGSAKLCKKAASLKWTIYKLEVK